MLRSDSGILVVRELDSIWGAGELAGREEAERFDPQPDADNAAVGIRLIHT